ncbi:putative MFS family arabinose efflux permease [Tumebacillus sp. BK434]|uniref:MFS transporter n=1 Tax=Tumebacillus sp. BK434 TaxID=2512169 RepID=UPI001045B106|nr:MFS transporter [Tumebacillus sp. BK434]TCP55756.1 putative MFS family arabinose efflux permease [Tumebacillus sp. BK434]
MNSWLWNFRVLWSAHFFSVASLTVLAPLLPFYLNEIGAGDTKQVLIWSGLALAAPAVSYTLTAPLWGKLGDQYGRKLMVVRALFGLALTLLLMSIARSPFEFFLYRLFQGAFGGVVDAGAAFAGSQAPEDQRGRVFGKLESAVSAGSLIGPLAGGLMVSFFGFRPLLQGLGVLVALMAVAAIFLLHEKRTPAASETEAVPEASGVFRTLQSFLRSRRLTAFLIGGLCANIAAYGLINVFAPHVQNLTGGDPDRAAATVGMLQAVMWGAALFGAAWWGRRNDRFPVERNFAWAALLCGLAVILQAVPETVGWLFALRLLQGFAFSALLQSVSFEISKSSTAANRGVRMGSASSILVAGQVGGALLGSTLGGFLSAPYVFLALGSVLILGALVVKFAGHLPKVSSVRYGGGVFKR